MLSSKDRFDDTNVKKNSIDENFPCHYYMFMLDSTRTTDAGIA